MTPDDQPYCGAELLPHATAADGSAAPAVCTLPLHGQDIMHANGKCSWAWQDARGNWLTRPVNP
jgi:hypothetical protein